MTEFPGSDDTERALSLEAYVRDVEDARRHRLVFEDFVRRQTEASERQTVALESIAKSLWWLTGGGK
jgi:hypothetical protein